MSAIIVFGPTTSHGEGRKQDAVRVKQDAEEVVREINESKDALVSLELDRRSAGVVWINRDLVRMVRATA